jgi:hypothetical protein
VDLNPKWGRSDDREAHRYITFDCPEGHDGCWHTIPFTPDLDGAQRISPQKNGAQWQRTGSNDRTFETLTLLPSIRRTPSYKSAADAIRDGCKFPVAPSLLCALHIYIKNGKIEFCADSR